MVHLLRRDHPEWRPPQGRRNPASRFPSKIYRRFFPEKCPL